MRELREVIRQLFAACDYIRLGQYATDRGTHVVQGKLVTDAEAIALLADGGS